MFCHNAYPANRARPVTTMGPHLFAVVAGEVRRVDAFRGRTELNGVGPSRLRLPEADPPRARAQIKRIGATHGGSHRRGCRRARRRRRSGGAHWSDGPGLPAPGCVAAGREVRRGRGGAAISQKASPERTNPGPPRGRARHHTPAPPHPAPFSSPAKQLAEKNRGDPPW